MHMEFDGGPLLGRWRKISRIYALTLPGARFNRTRLLVCADTPDVASQSAPTSAATQLKTQGHLAHVMWDVGPVYLSLRWAPLLSPGAG